MLLTSFIKSQDQSWGVSTTPNLWGDDYVMEPPDPIPNSEVKHVSADDTAVSGRGKVGRRLIFFVLKIIKIWEIFNRL